MVDQRSEFAKYNPTLHATTPVNILVFAVTENMGAYLTPDAQKGIATLQAQIRARFRRDRLPGTRFRVR
jgi:hypothetical protein